MARLAAGLLVQALIRRVQAEGGSAAVLARGDQTSGAVLVQLASHGVEGELVERVLDPQGRYRWAAVGPAEGRGDYLARRRRVDPDLWVVELDHEEARGILEDATGHI